MKIWNKFPRIIFFLKGMEATVEEMREAIKYGTNVVFRNSTHINPAHNVEDCDGVAGAVPECYSTKFKHAEQVVGDFFDKIEREIGAKSPASDPAVQAAASAPGPANADAPPAAPAPAPASQPPAPPATPPAPPVGSAGWGPNPAAPQ